MKTYARTSIALAGLAFIVTATVANAQTSTATITKVPFAFNVGASQMPGDTYRLSKIGGHTDVFMISSLRHSVILLGQPDGRKTDESPRLVFHKYGDEYFLREFWSGGSTGFSLPESRQERQAEERIAGRSTPERIVVLANKEKREGR
jgi:hypothetical protein